MNIRKLTATLGLAALAILGAASISHYTVPDALASAHRPGESTFIPPTVPVMRLGVTLGEPTSTVPAHHKA